MLDDAELLRRYTEEGSEASFTELVRRHVDLVYGAALRRSGGDAHRAADISQVVFTALARHATKLSRHAALSGWLYTTTRNAAIDAVRQAQRRSARESDPRVRDEIMIPPTDVFDWAQLRPVLDDAMDDLGEKEREALLLRFFENHSYAEIARQVGSTEDGTRMQIGRALDKLQRALAQRGVTSTSAALATGLVGQVATAAPSGLSAALASVALAHSAAVGTVGFWASLLHFMGTKLATTTAAGAALLAIGSAVYQTQATRHETELAASLQRQHATLLASVEESSRRLAQAEQDVARLQAALDQRAKSPAVRSIPPGRPSTALPARPEAERVAAGRAFLAAHPDLKAIITADEKWNVSHQFYAFYRRAGLSAEQIQSFEELQLNGRGMSVDFPHTGLGQMKLDPGEGLSPEQVDEKVHALLDDDRYRLYQGAANSGRELFLATKLASTLHSTDAPLSATQGEQLISALLANHPTAKTGELFDGNIPPENSLAS